MKPKKPQPVAPHYVGTFRPYKMSRDLQQAAERAAKFQPPMYSISTRGRDA